MQVFLTLLLKILPLYGIIAVAFVCGFFLKFDRRYITKPLIYFIMPVVVFAGVVNAQLSLGTLSLPVLFFTVGTVLSFIVYKIARTFWKDSTKNVLAFTSGTGNTGYFGIPVAIAIFGQNILSLAVITTLGLILFENSVGFYHIARGHYSVKESMLKLIKLPAIWAFIFGILVNIFGLHLGQTFLSVTSVFKNLYIILGMAVIGFGLAGIKGYKFDLKFLSFAFIVKFIVWPMIILGIILIDKSFLHIFSQDNYRIMILMSIVPMAANTVVFATELKAEPEKAALAVFSSTILALFYIPLLVSVFFK